MCDISVTKVFTKRKHAERPRPPLSPCIGMGSGVEDKKLRTLLEESAFQILAQKTISKKPQKDTAQTQNAPVDANLYYISFPKRLWTIVESDIIESIKWDQTGMYIVIDEELFTSEVLKRFEPHKIFQTTGLKSFVRQLNVYGFKRAFPGIERSASLSTFIAEEDNACTSKLQYYSNPNFRQGFKHLLPQMKRCVQLKGTRLGIGREKLGHSNKNSAGQQHSPRLADTGNPTPTRLNCRAPLLSISAMSLAPDVCTPAQEAERSEESRSPSSHSTGLLPKLISVLKKMSRDSQEACLAQIQTHMTTFGLQLVMAGMTPLPSFTPSLPPELHLPELQKFR